MTLIIDSVGFIAEYWQINPMNQMSDVNISSPDGVTEVLAGDADSGARHADHHGHLVVKLERPVVNVCLLEVEIVGEITQ